MNSWPIILVAWAVGVVHGVLLRRWFTAWFLRRGLRNSIVHDHRRWE
jgi:hypothetical protein